MTSEPTAVVVKARYLGKAIPRLQRSSLHLDFLPGLHFPYFRFRTRLRIISGEQGTSSTNHIWTRAHNFSKQVESFICSWSAFAPQGIGIPHWGHCICRPHTGTRQAGEQTWASQPGPASSPVSIATRMPWGRRQKAGGRRQERGLSGHTLWHVDTGYSHGSGPSRLSGQSQPALSSATAVWKWSSKSFLLMQVQTFSSGTYKRIQLMPSQHHQ